MTAEQPVFLLWIVLTAAVTWALPRRLLPVVLVATCIAYLGIYSPLSLVALMAVTAVAGLALITGRGRHGFVMAAIVACCLMFVVYRSMTSNSEIFEVICECRSFSGICCHVCPAPEARES